MAATARAGLPPRAARPAHDFIRRRPTDRVSHRHFEKQLTKKNEGLARSLGGVPVQSGQVKSSRVTLRVAVADLLQNDKMIEQLPPPPPPPRRIATGAPFRDRGRRRRQRHIVQKSRSTFYPLFSTTLLSLTKRGRGEGTKNASWGPDVTRSPDLV